MTSFGVMLAVFAPKQYLFGLFILLESPLLFYDSSQGIATLHQYVPVATTHPRGSYCCVLRGRERNFKGKRHYHETVVDCVMRFKRRRLDTDCSGNKEEPQRVLSK